MKKFFIFLAMIASPAMAQEPEEINYYARDFPMFAEADRGSEIERKYNNYIKAADAHAKVLAKRKVQEPVIRVEGTIVVKVRIDDGYYRPTCSYGSC